jgi:hypothetical protein
MAVTARVRLGLRKCPLPASGGCRRYQCLSTLLRRPRRRKRLWNPWKVWTNPLVGRPGRGSPVLKDLAPASDVHNRNVSLDEVVRLAEQARERRRLLGRRNGEALSQSRGEVGRSDVESLRQGVGRLETRSVLLVQREYGGVETAGDPAHRRGQEHRVAPLHGFDPDPCAGRASTNRGVAGEQRPHQAPAPRRRALAHRPIIGAA